MGADKRARRARCRLSSRLALQLVRGARSAHRKNLRTAAAGYAQPYREHGEHAQRATHPLAPNGERLPPRKGRCPRAPPWDWRPLPAGG
eukprot:6822790-Pyramimonas_sp.AAC.1